MKNKNWIKCIHLMKCVEDKQGNTVCGAHLTERRALPCVRENCKKPDFELAKPGEETASPPGGWI